MKHLLFLLLVLGCTLDKVQAKKTFQIIKIKGTVTLGSTGLELAARSYFTDKDTLRFSNQEDRLAVIDQRQLAYIVIPQPDLNSYSLKPIQQRINTRPWKILNRNSFKEYIANQSIVILGGQRWIHIPIQDFPLGDRQYFFIRYNLKGDPRPVNKKLSFQGEAILLDQQELFTVAGEQVEPAHTSNFRLFYNDALQSISEEIGPIQMIFPDEALLRRELHEIHPQKKLNQRKSQSYEQFVENYLLAFYGHIELADVEKWLKN